jgi:hypothetical protein
MTAAKKRNPFEEIREGLEAYRDRRDTLPRRELSDRPSGTGAKKTRRRRRLG